MTVRGSAIPRQHITVLLSYGTHIRSEHPPNEALKLQSRSLRPALSIFPNPVISEVQVERQALPLEVARNTVSIANRTRTG
jgi:hypothetical protein